MERVFVRSALRNVTTCCLVILIGLFAGCAEESDPSPNVSPPSVSPAEPLSPVENTEYDPRIIGRWASDDANDGTWEFRADGSLTITQPGMTTNGDVTWNGKGAFTLTGEIVTKSRQFETKQEFVVKQLDEEQLAIKYPDEEYTFNLRRVK